MTSFASKLCLNQSTLQRAQVSCPPSGFSKDTAESGRSCSSVPPLPRASGDGEGGAQVPSTRGSSCSPSLLPGGAEKPSRSCSPRSGRGSSFPPGSPDQHGSRCSTPAPRRLNHSSHPSSSSSAVLLTCRGLVPFSETKDPREASSISPQQKDASPERLRRRSPLEGCSLAAWGPPNPASPRAQAQLTAHGKKLQETAGECSSERTSTLYANTRPSRTSLILGYF